MPSSPVRLRSPPVLVTNASRTESKEGPTHTGTRAELCRSFFESEAGPENEGRRLVTASVRTPHSGKPRCLTVFPQNPMTMELRPSGARILQLSRGWIWRVSLIGTGDSTARIDQSHHDAAQAHNSIQFPVIDLPRVAGWIRGSYSAEEWPSHERFSDGTVLRMDPNPKPELQIEQRRNQEEISTTTGRGSEIVASLTLYEEDLIPLVEWLLEVSSELGVDLVSQRRLRDALARSESRNQPASIPLAESPASSVQTPEPADLHPEPSDLLDDRAEEDFSIGSIVSQKREVPEYPTDRRAEPEIRGRWLRLLIKTIGEALLTLAILAFVIWEFVVAYQPGMITDFIGGIVVMVVIMNGHHISKYWRKFYLAAKSRLRAKQEQSEP